MRATMTLPFLPLTLALGLTTTAPALADAQDPPLQVLATVGMVADIAANIGGSCTNVQALLGPGTDPHDYSATPRDVQALSQADLILYVGRVLEERLADVLDSLRGRRAVLGLLDTAFAPDDLLQDPDAPGQPDPHVWMDVSRWAQIIPVLTETLTQQRPDCADLFQENALRLDAELVALHDWVGGAIGSIPEAQRALVTAHDAFNYFADAYGMTASEAIEGISTVSEASIADIRAVAAYVMENGIPAVFVETTVSPRTIEALLEEVRATGHALEIGGELFSDALGETGTPEGSYIGMIRANTITITEALGGRVPDWPEALQAWAESWDQIE